MHTEAPSRGEKDDRVTHIEPHGSAYVPVMDRLNSMGNLHGSSLMSFEQIADDELDQQSFQGAGLSSERKKRRISFSTAYTKLTMNVGRYALCAPESDCDD